MLYASVELFQKMMYIVVVQIAVIQKWDHRMRCDFMTIMYAINGKFGFGVIRQSLWSLHDVPCIKLYRFC